MKPAGVYVCPKCGTSRWPVRTLIPTPGENSKNLGEQRQPTKAEKQAWWSQIKFYQRQRVSLGKKPVSDAWCAHTFRERFGVWPNGLSDYPMDITPTVSNFIKHKRISFAKRIEAQQRQQAQAEEQPTQERIQQALNRVSDIRQQLGKRA
jgi:hypothetical protein